MLADPSGDTVELGHMCALGIAIWLRCRNSSSRVRKIMPASVSVMSSASLDSREPYSSCASPVPARSLVR